jgi:hypothetical protein
VNTDVVELLVETTNDVEDECPVKDVLTEATQGIRHGLEAPTIFSDAEVALDEGAELGVEEEGVLLPIAEELRLNSEPDDACIGFRLQHSLHEVIGDRPVYP